MLLRQPKVALIILIGLYFVFGVRQIIATPVFEKGDEEYHAAYIQYLREQQRLPPLIIDADINPADQIAGHPPLYYGIAALITQRLGLAPAELKPNPFWGYPAAGTVHDNKNRFLHEPNEIARPDLRPFYILRSLSLALGVGTIIAAYGLAFALTGEIVIALMSAGFIAIMPQYSFIASAISNDALVASLTGLGLLALLHAAANGERWRGWAVFGVIAGLAALTKANAMLLPLFGAGLAVVLGWRRRSVRTLIIGVTMSLGLWLAIAGWWYMRNWLGYRDPLGTGVHVAQYGQESALFALRSLPDLWAQTSTTFWAAFGWSNVQFPPWAYQVLRVFEVISLLGLLWVAIRSARHSTNRMAWIIVAGFTGLMLLAYVWWTLTVHGTLGRLLFPVLAPLAVLFCVGLRRWSGGALAAAWSFVAVMALLAPAFITPAYQPPPVLAAAMTLPDVAPSNIMFADVARLSAAQASPSRIRPGASLTVTLCWESLRTIADDYTVFVQILADGDKKIGERNTYPGLGRFPTSQWRPGQSFCDEVNVPVDLTAPPNATYDVVVGLFDLASGKRLPMRDASGQPIDALVIDQIKVTGSGKTPPASAQAMGANFANQIMLTAYVYEPVDASNQIALSLYWQALASLNSDYTIFVHILDATGQLVAQTDSPPQQGRYATRWWDVGEVVKDTHILVLPDDLLPGDYRVLIGLYLPQTGERLRLGDGMTDSVELAPLLWKP